MQNEMACCAHLNVLYVRINNQNGTCSDSWQCRDCKTLFKPFIPVTPAPIAAQTERMFCKNCNLQIYLDKNDVLGQKWRHHGSNFVLCFGPFDTNAEPKTQPAEQVDAARLGANVLAQTRPIKPTAEYVLADFEKWYADIPYKGANKDALFRDWMYMKLLELYKKHVLAASLKQETCANCHGSKRVFDGWEDTSPCPDCSGESK